MADEKVRKQQEKEELGQQLEHYSKTYGIYEQIISLQTLLTQISGIYVVVTGGLWTAVVSPELKLNVGPQVVILVCIFSRLCGYYLGSLDTLVQQKHASLNSKRSMRLCCLVSRDSARKVTLRYTLSGNDDGVGVSNVGSGLSFRY